MQVELGSKRVIEVVPQHHHVHSTNRETRRTTGDALRGGRGGERLGHGYDHALCCLTKHTSNFLL